MFKIVVKIKMCIIFHFWCYRPDLLYVTLNVVHVWGGYSQKFKNKARNMIFEGFWIPQTQKYAGANRVNTQNLQRVQGMVYFLISLWLRLYREWKLYVLWKCGKCGPCSISMNISHYCNYLNTINLFLRYFSPTRTTGWRLYTGP